MNKPQKLLTALIVLMCALNGSVSAQTKNITQGYTAKIQTEGLLWSLRVNDLFVRENGEYGVATSLGDIGMRLQPGRNTISMLFSPLTGKTSADGEYLFELSDGLLIDISIQRMDYTTRKEQEINAVTLRYDMALKKFVAQDKTASGVKPVWKQPQLGTDGKFTISDLPPKAIVFRTADRFGGYRLDFAIEVEDNEFPQFHWRDKAVQLKDTPETRQEFLKAYRDLHQLIARGDKDAILREARPVWERTAFILTSKSSSAEEFVESTELGFGLFKQTHPDGSELQALRMKNTIENAALQFMDGGRLVRIRPDPIVWALPVGRGGGITSIFPVVFYKSKEGKWHIADINVGL